MALVRTCTAGGYLQSCRKSSGISPFPAFFISSRSCFSLCTIRHTVKFLSLLAQTHTCTEKYYKWTSASAADGLWIMHTSWQSAHFSPKAGRISAQSCVVVAFSSHARIFGRGVRAFIPTCAFFFKVEISSHTLTPLFMSGSVHSGSAS